MFSSSSRTLSLPSLYKLVGTTHVILLYNIQSLANYRDMTHLDSGYMVSSNVVFSLTFYAIVYLQSRAIKLEVREGGRGGGHTGNKGGG